MSVSVKIRLAVSMAMRSVIRSWSPASCHCLERSSADRIWLRISRSPMTMDSKPALTRNRCRAASSPCKTMAVPMSDRNSAASGSKAWNNCCNRPMQKYASSTMMNSTRLQVVR